MAASANRRFEFHKRSQFFIRTHNETFSVIRVYGAAGNVIETHEHKGDFKER
jgi:quercetin dioxygenase-like cupin family protein